VLVPHLQKVAACIRVQGHLLAPGPELVESDVMFSALESILGMSMLKFAGGTLRNLYNHYAGFCDSWEPLLARWERSDFEIIVSQHLYYVAIHVYCQSSVRATITMWLTFI
jgi:hypothetical protein